MTLPIPPELPLLPTPRERAFLMLMNPDADLGALTAVIEGDPSLTTAALRAANSAMSWPVRQIRTAPEAVVRLGSTAVRHLITATVVRSQFATIEAAGIDADELWRHLLGCALLSEPQAPSEEMRQVYFTAGLLHDLGRLAMAAQAPSRYRDVVFEAQDGADAGDTERYLFGIDHSEFGLRICERWHLPDEIALAVAQHHDAEPAPGIPAALATARDLTRDLGIGDGVHRPARREASAEEHPLLVRAGGLPEFMSSIRWFRDATTGRKTA